jgi:hypothetical protein
MALDRRWWEPVSNTSTSCRRFSYNLAGDPDRRQEKPSTEDRVIATAESYAREFAARSQGISHRNIQFREMTDLVVREIFHAAAGLAPRRSRKRC